MKHFLSYRFDERDGSLSRESKGIAITRKASDLLRCLIERAGSVVSHDAILAAVWPDAHVQPDNIKVLIRELRRALDDDSHDPRYIRTENGRGYAFVAPLHDSPSAETPGRSSQRHIRASRGQHFAVLADALADASHSRCMVVIVEGERGIGKTALCEAFMEYAATLPSVRVCYGQSLPHVGVPPAYATITDALADLLRQSPSIEPLLAKHAPLWLAHLRQAEPGRPADAAVDPLRRVFELGAFLEALADEGTTAIVLDDLQWADAETVTLVQALARRHAPLRTLIVATCTRLPPTASGTALWRMLMELWSTGRCVMRRLKPLSEEDVKGSLIDRFGAGPIAALAPTFHRLTGGNPLALSAVMHALVAAEFVVRGPSGWQFCQPAIAFEASLPDNAREALLWRFTQLDQSNRTLLESAAAVGPTFTGEDVALAAAVQTVARVEHQLDALCARGFIERVAELTSSAKRYAFAHPLHAELLSSRTALFDQLYAAERLAAGDSGTAGIYN